MPFGSLWIPVVVSTVAVFIGSSIIHMALKYHKTDFKPMPNEEAIREAINKGNPPPGLYFMPYCAEMRQMKEPAFKAKFDAGPVAMITVSPKGLPNMGKHLSLWFIFCFIVSFVSAYVARHTLHPGGDGVLPMQITGTVAFAAYGLSQVVDSIWKGQPWSNTVKHVVDGMIYALLTGVTFKLLWPAA